MSRSNLTDVGPSRGRCCQRGRIDFECALGATVRSPISMQPRAPQGSLAPQGFWHPKDDRGRPQPMGSDLALASPELSGTVPMNAEEPTPKWS